MENQNNIKAHDISECLEQIRAGFTISRMTFGALTLLYSLAKKDEKWAKKFTNLQNSYHKFLLDSYTELEKIYKDTLDREKVNSKPSEDSSSSS